MSLWGGAFESGSSSGVDPLFKRFNDSLRFDYRLLPHDVRGSVAWARALAAAGVLTEDELGAIIGGLDRVLVAVAENPSILAEADDEDVHSYVEARLTDDIGEPAKKLHTGRSRNDQVATDLRLYLRDELGARLAELRGLQRAVLDCAERHSGAVVPGYTHLQLAQPILFGHWCLAYFEMLGRDANRLAAAADRAADECPLGSAALAGTAFPVDRAAIARELGFRRPSANSIDAIAARDVALEALAALASTALTLSRLAEDLVIYATTEFGYARLSEAVSTGSSIMPQKRNPDALELLRGKAGRVLASHHALAVTTKALPLAYNKDLQEDKEPIFDALDTMAQCLPVASVVFEGLEIDAARARAAAGRGCSNATDLADGLARRGVPFREAHHIAGRVARLAGDRGVAIEDLPVADLRTIDERIDDELIASITLDAVLARRDRPGGTAPARVAEALAVARRALHRATEPPAAPRQPGRPA